jgi:GNAT superfamily N-acetyltransferase
MTDLSIRVRRGRRTDFIDVMRLLANGTPTPPVPDRATLRRFRHIVADLGGDFYLALVDGRLAGCVHVTYARQLAAAPRASLGVLVVSPAYRRHGIGSKLLAFAQQRAEKRGCAVLQCTLSPEAVAARRFLEQAGWVREAETFDRRLRLDG